MNRISRLFSRLFPTNIYTDPIERRQAIGTYGSGLLLAVACFIFLVFDLTSQNNYYATKPAYTAFLDYGGNIALMLGSILAILWTRQKRQARGGLVLITVWSVYSALLVFGGSIPVATYIPVAMITLSLGALLIGERSIPYMCILAIFTTISGVYLDSTLKDDAIFTIVEYMLLILLAAGLNVLLAQGLRGIARQVAANINERRLQLAEASSTVTQQLLGTRLDLQKLLGETVQLVHNSFPDIDHVQLFLVDKDHRNAELIATTNSGSESNVGSKVGVGSLSVVGRVTLGGQEILIRNTSDDQSYRRSEFLPEMVAELVLPLRVGGDTIGALDLQSKTPTAFDSGELETLQTLTNQIAIAIDNARLFAQAEERSAENKRLYEQTRNNLHEIERLNQHLTGTAWTEYLRGTPSVPAYSIDLTSGQVEDAADWTPTLAEASRRNQVIVRPSGNQKIIAMPISVRGQVIGAMEFEVNADYNPSQEEMTILQQVIERLGLAAENARLFEEAQRIAQREAMVNEISTRMQAMNNVEAVIAATTQSLADAFKSPRVSIRLGSPNEE